MPVLKVVFGGEEEEGFARRPRRKKEAEKEGAGEGEEDEIPVETVVDVVVDVREEGMKACRQVRLRRKPSTWELIGACLRVRLRWRCALLLVEWCRDVDLVPDAVPWTAITCRSGEPGGLVTTADLVMLYDKLTLFGC